MYQSHMSRVQTYKPFTIAAGLEEGVVHDGDTYECKGYEYVGPDMIKCHSYSTIGSHGVLTLSQALENSCNPYMINIAIKLGNVRFAQYEKYVWIWCKDWCRPSW